MVPTTTAFRTRNQVGSGSFTLWAIVPTPHGPMKDDIVDVAP